MNKQLLYETSIDLDDGTSIFLRLLSDYEEEPDGKYLLTFPAMGLLIHAPTLNDVWRNGHQVMTRLLQHQTEVLGGQGMREYLDQCRVLHWMNTTPPGTTYTYNVPYRIELSAPMDQVQTPELTAATPENE